MEIPKDEYETIAAEIHSSESLVGIDAKKTHIIIIHLLRDISKRVVKLEEKLENITS